MLQIFKGVAFRRRITVVNESGARANLTGKAVSVQIRRRPGESPALSLEVGSGVTLLAQSGATLGQADLDASSAQTGALATSATTTIVVFVDGQLALAPTKLPVRAL